MIYLGIMIPEKATLSIEKKRVVYGSRQRSKKADTHKGEYSQIHCYGEVWN